MPGKSWGQWINRGALDEGGSAWVFKVENSATGADGALKLLKNPDRTDRLQHELGAIKELDHPGIARLLDSDMEAERPYIVTEYEPGGTLGALCTEKLLSLPIADRLALAEHICEALQAAHDCGHIHRDIKPDNVLLSEDCQRVRLCDFGLVWCEDGERVTATLEQVGSRYYIPPELEDGRADAVCARSDVYSMGKLLYYLMTGRVFARERHREDLYDLAQVFGDPYLEAVSRVLDRAITVAIHDRWTSAHDMQMAIQHARRTVMDQLPIEGQIETYQCLFCRSGTYRLVGTSIDQRSHNLGYGAEGRIGKEQMAYLECDKCGNSQRFKLKIAGAQWFPELVTRHEQYFRDR